MAKFQLTTPVVFIIFNRPDTTLTVFEEIKHARPQKLFVVADGPRKDKPGEFENCQAVRKIINSVNWPCEVLKNYSDINLGCKKRVSSGLDWVFSQVEEAIILEDDCFPDISFFQYCSELLAKYRNIDSVMMISGHNLTNKWENINNSYYFSRYPEVWGWATWRNAWKKYDLTMKEWPEFKKNKMLEKMFKDPKNIIKWYVDFRTCYENRADTWDYAWVFSCWLNNGLCVIPTVNMIENIGFDKSATHTKEGTSLFRKSIKFPLKHPPEIERFEEADKYYDKFNFTVPNWVVPWTKFKSFFGIGKIL